MKTTETPAPRLYSVRAAAALLGVGRTTAWKLVSDGTLETVHIGGRRMVRATSLEAVIANGTQNRAA
jgi:excisionase family DNA binding protein